MILEGGISKTYNQNWDKNGNIYYTDENGKVVDFKVNPFAKLANKVKATATNIGDWINETNPNSEAYKQKVGVALGLATAPLGLGATLTGGIARGLTPYVGRKIAQNMAQGIGSGVAGGGVVGGVEAGLNDRNIAIGGLQGATVGGLLGGLGGYGLGKVAQKFERAKLPNNPQIQEQYFNDYVADLSNKTNAMADFRAGKLGVKNGKMGKAYDSTNPRHVLQAKLINEVNPANDSYHTWIRTADDIYDFEDTLKAPVFDEDFIGNDFDPSYSWDMAQDALRNGEIEVFSSYPIKEGTFVTPSSMEASYYSGNGKIYNKIVPLEDVGWIDATQGQYAPIRNLK